MTESHEGKLLAMKDFILKVHRARAGSAEVGGSDGEDQDKSGVINIRHLGYVITRRHADLHKNKDAAAEATATTKSQKKKQQKTETPTAMNAEWRKMFGADDSDQSSQDSPVKGRHPTVMEKVGDGLDPKKRMTPPPASLSPALLGDGAAPHPPHLMMEPLMPLANLSNKPVQSRFAQCKWDLRNCVHHLRRRFDTEVMSRDLVEGIMWDSRPPPDKWRPKGVLVAHLQEHRGAVNRLCVSPDHKFFASCSNDSTVRLWEVSRLEGKTAANRSQLVFNKQSGSIKCLTFCGSSNRLAAASDLGSLNIYTQCVVDAFIELLMQWCLFLLVQCVLDAFIELLMQWCLFLLVQCVLDAFIELLMQWCLFLLVQCVLDAFIELLMQWCLFLLVQCVLDAFIELLMQWCLFLLVQCVLDAFIELLMQWCLFLLVQCVLDALIELLMQWCLFLLVPGPWTLACEHVLCWRAFLIVRVLWCGRLDEDGAKTHCAVTCEESVPHVRVLWCGRLDGVGGPTRDTLDYDKENKGAIMDLAYFDTGAQSILTFATVHGYIVGWDLRCREPAWVLKHDTRMGVITALAVHKTQSWMGVGTSVGNHNVWDLRFMLSIAAPTIRHRAKKRVRRMVMHPQKQSWFASAVEWNNEVSMWNVESMMRQEMLWASPYPPFTEMEVT
ncbi:hypothetical protein ACOMHN_033899 [Nucella lapillus]